MKIEEAYLHVLDANANIKLLSERPMALDVDVEEYAIKHVEGFFEHLDIVETALMQTTKIDYRNDDFKLLTIEIADLFFDAMQKSEDIKACDLMCLKFEREDEHFVGFLKLNFKRGCKNLKVLIYSFVDVKHLRLRTMSSMTSPPQRTLG